MWDRIYTGILTGNEFIRKEYGLRMVFHPHTGTAIEYTAKKERLLSEGEVFLYFDTGFVQSNCTVLIQNTVMEFNKSRVLHAGQKVVQTFIWLLPESNIQVCVNAVTGKGEAVCAGDASFFVDKGLLNYVF